MKLADTINRAGRSLKNAKARTLLTSLAIGVGAFTITLSLAAGEGGRGYTDAIVNANTSLTEIVVTQKQPEAMTGPQKYIEGSASNVTAGDAAAGMMGGGAGRISFLTEQDLEDIQNIEGVESISPNYSPAVRYIGNGDNKYLVDSITTFSESVTGEYAAGNVDGGLKDGDIIIPEGYIEVLGFKNFQDAIGKKVVLKADRLASYASGIPESKDFEFTIRAVSSKSGMAFRAQSSLQLSLESNKGLYEYINSGTQGYGNFLLAAVEIKDANDAEKIKDILVGKGYEAQTATDILGIVNTFINVLQGILLGFGALAVLTSVFGIINTQYISVLERTQQIGLMKALGMRRRDVGRLFKFEAAWIGFLGGTIGAGLAVLIGSVANPAISEALSIGDIYLLEFTPWAVSGVVIGLILVAVAAGIAPARKAAKLDPIEALRTE